MRHIVVNSSTTLLIYYYTTILQVLHLESAEGIFGGWASPAAGGGGRAARAAFEEMMNRDVYGGTWCCSSWYARLSVLPCTYFSGLVPFRPARSDLKLM